MKDRHPVITAWAEKKRQAEIAFRRGKGPHVQGFNNLDYRQHRILSQIFFGVEQHGVEPGSAGWPEFHFKYRDTITRASLAPIDPYVHRSDAKLRFVIDDPSPDGSVPYAEWSEEEVLLEDKIPEIVGAILAATRAVARAYREQAMASIETAVARLLDKMKDLEEPQADGFAARCDPRTMQTLLEMAERHRAAALIRRFLHSLSKTIADGSVVVADHSLDDWMSWATAKTDEYDPLLQGAEYVFEKLVKA